MTKMRHVRASRDEVSIMLECSMMVDARTGQVKPKALTREVKLMAAWPRLAVSTKNWRRI